MSWPPGRDCFSQRTSDEFVFIGPADFSLTKGVPLQTPTLVFFLPLLHVLAGFFPPSLLPPT